MIEFHATLPALSEFGEDEIKKGLPIDKVTITLDSDTCLTIDNAQIKTHRVNVIVNGKKYPGCHLHKTDEGLYTIGLVRSLVRHIGLGQSFCGTIEEFGRGHNFETMNNAVLEWEQGAGKELMRKVGVKEGDVVVDFGCGFGHYTIPCALALNNTGKVYAIDTGGRELKWIEQKCSMFGVSNVETIRTKGKLTLDMPDESVDFVLLYDVLHYFGDGSESEAKQSARMIVFNETHRVLKQGGIISVTKFESDNNTKANKSYFGKPMHEVFYDEIIGAGFMFSHEVEDAVHFDWFHSAHRVNMGLQFSEMEKGVLMNFVKI